MTLTVARQTSPMKWAATTMDVQNGLTCASNSTICEHTCTDFPEHNGFFCSCQRGFSMEKLDVHSDNNTSVSGFHRHTCDDINECDSYSMNKCTQKFINMKGSFKCACDKDYFDPHGDGTICKAGKTGEDAVVLLAYGSEIRQLQQNISQYVYAGLIESEDFILSMEIDPINR